MHHLLCGNRGKFHITRGLATDFRAENRNGTTSLSVESDTLVCLFSYWQMKLCVCMMKRCGSLFLDKDVLHACEEIRRNRNFPNQTSPLGTLHFLSVNPHPLNASDSPKHLNIFAGIHLRSHDSLLGRVIPSQSVTVRATTAAELAASARTKEQDSDKRYTRAADFCPTFEASVSENCANPAAKAPATRNRAGNRLLRLLLLLSASPNPPKIHFRDSHPPKL